MYRQFMDALKLMKWAEHRPLCLSRFEQTWFNRRNTARNTCPASIAVISLFSTAGRHLLILIAVYCFLISKLMAYRKIFCNTVTKASNHARFKTVVLNLFLYILPPFIRQDYQIYPQYTPWCLFLPFVVSCIQKMKLTNSYSLEWFIKIYFCCNLWFS